MISQLEPMLPFVGNWTTCHYGGFVGTFDAEFRPGPYIAGFHVFVSKGKVLVGPPQNDQHDNLFDFASGSACKEFSKYVLGVLLTDQKFVEALRRQGVPDLYAACGLGTGGEAYGS